MHPGGRVGLRTRAPRLRGSLVALAVVMGALVCTAPAAAHSFPVPKCRWASPSIIDRSFGLKVTARKPSWKTQIAPVLTCSLLEQQQSLEYSGKPIVQVVFREMQRFKVYSPMTPVRGLGSCRRRVSCPEGGGHRAAWIETATSASLSGSPFTSGLYLQVEDGLNMFTIEVDNPFGPLPVNESKAAIHLATRLVHHFRWK